MSWNLEILCLRWTHSLLLFNRANRITCFLCAWLCASTQSSWESSWNFTFFLVTLLKTDWTAFLSGYLCVEWMKCRSVAPCCNCLSSLYFMLIDFFFPATVHLLSGATDSSDSSHEGTEPACAHEPQALNFFLKCPTKCQKIFNAC